MRDELKRALRSIGKTSFVEYFTDYQELALSKEKPTREEKMLLAKKLLESNPNATTLDGQIIRISYAIKVFRNEWENDLLREVIASKNSRVTEAIKERARVLLTD